MLRTLLPCLILLSSLLLTWAHPPTALAPVQDMSDVTIEAIAVTDGLYMLTGAGGNMGLFIGVDGAFLIDDQFAPLSQRILDKVAELTDEPVRFLVNTHWHFDHTGGNENLGKAGAVIVAHENVRKRMSIEQTIEAFDRTTPPAPEAALPKLTFTESVTFHWNGDEIFIFHVDDAHTDGDSIIVFRGADAIHMGDTYFNGLYPFIDTGRRGNIDGMIAAANHVLELATDSTRIIPGHGPLSNKAELLAYRDMLVIARDAIADLVDQGLSRDEVVAARPTQDLDPVWGNGFMAPDAWVGIVYDGMVAR